MLDSGVNFKINTQSVKIWDEQTKFLLIIGGFPSKFFVLLHKGKPATHVSIPFAGLLYNKTYHVNKCACNDRYEVSILCARWFPSYTFIKTGKIKNRIGSPSGKIQWTGTGWLFAHHWNSWIRNIKTYFSLIPFWTWPIGLNSFLAKNRFFIIFSSILGILQPFFRFEFKNRFDKT